MWKEKHPAEPARWPEGVRLPIIISVHHQSEEAPCPFPDGQPDPFDYSERQYGGRRGAWRILEILEKYRVKGTWLICGATLEKYPDISKAVKKAGHTIAGHAYHHEFVCNLPPDEEVAVMRKTVTVFEDMLSEHLRGWRTCFASHNTIDLILEHFDFEWDTSRWNDDRPYILEGHGREMIEIPFFAPGDPAYSTQITQPFAPPSQYSTWASAPPEFTLRAYKAVFHALYETSKEQACMFPLTIHDFITGRPAKSKPLDEFIAYAKQFEGVVFTTHDELATWWRANYQVKTS
jgi:peptidoglycan-N-acetylglucosamine deacetylase